MTRAAGTISICRQPHALLDVLQEAEVVRVFVKISGDVAVENEPDVVAVVRDDRVHVSMRIVL